MPLQSLKPFQYPAASHQHPTTIPQHPGDFHKKTAFQALFAYLSRHLWLCYWGISTALNRFGSVFENDLSLFWELMSLLQIRQLDNTLRLTPQALSIYPVHNRDTSPQNSDKLLYKVR